jgi:Domain of unknown function (DUF4396)
MPPFWFEILAIVAVAVALICAAVILVDILAGHRQVMAVMNWVWPITALCFGPIAIYAYCKLGRPSSIQRLRTVHCGEQHHEPAMASHHEQAQQRPFWQTVLLGVTHCGAGCTLGDLIGEWAIFIMGVTIAGQEFWPEILLDFTLAYLLGIAFQYFAIAPMRGIRGWPGIWAAVKADTLSLSAFEVGLFAWMAIFMFVIFPHTHPDNPAYWFMMQIGMVIGFGTSYPMNWWLIKCGLKVRM